MNVDAAGISHEGFAALDRMRAGANAPLFSYDAVYFGHGIVGGAMFSVEEVNV